ncbi:MAG: amino acid adenylation domain-containing protein, partial [Okeania sp. SIO1H6]|nr:amino acid adenylation domain-containing protein [Okeania sp. SIO1H6]
MNNLVAETEQEITEGYGLSPQQKHLWLLQKTEKTGIYLAQCAISIPGKVDVPRLKSALQKIVERHEILRTNFDSLPGMIIGVQIIRDDNISCNIFWEKEYDLTQVEPTHKTAEFARILENLAQNFFDLKKDSLFHASIVKVSPEQQTLLITLPALIADSKSLQLLVDELNQEYVACLKGNELSEAELQYADIAEWQNQLLEAEEAKLGKEYWEKQDISNRFNLKLPFEKQSEAFQPKVQKNIIDSDLATKVENIAKQLDISTSDFFLTCWLILIWRLTGKLNIVVGLVSDGRKYEDLEQALGLFAKHLPLSFQVQEDLKFNELLEQVKASISDIFKWQDYFTWEQFISTTENYSEQYFLPLSFEFIELNNVSQNVDFQIDRIYTCTDKYKIKLVITQDNNLSAEFHYDANAYNSEDIQILTEQFQVLLASVVENPVADISKLKINASHHLQQLLIDFNQTQESYPQDKCIHQLFEEQVQKTPDAVAVVFEKQQLTYQQLNTKANQLAHYLQSLGVKPETLVGICINRSPEMIVGLLGILKAGGAYVPIDPSYPTERLAYMLQDAAMPVLLTSESVLPSLPEHSAQVICLDTNWDTIANQSIENPVIEVTPDNLAYVIYTSGSTGKPKGTMIIHRGVVNYLSWCTKAYQVKEGNGVPVNSSIGFDATVTAFFSPLLTGKEMILLPEDNEIEALKELLCSQRNLSLVKLTPAHLQILNTLIPPEKASEQTRAFIIGGEALPATTVSFWSNNAPQTKLINEYGPTETVVGCCVYQVKPEDSLKEVIPIGCPIANTQLYILDQHQQPVPLGVPGELHIGGAGLARGYLNRPELTAAKFIPNPFDNNNSKLYKTGDLARYLSDGTIEYLGRIDNQIKIRGFRIELGEIESVLSSHPQVQQTVVVCREDTPENKQLVAYIVGVEGTQEITELRSYLVSKLPEYMVPSAFVFLDVLPLTANGKVDRKALPAPDELTNSLEYVPPQNPTQEIITNIFAGVLGITKVGIHDNFFSLGGHSLLATQVISRIRQYLEVEIAFKTLFEFPTAAELDQKLNELRATNSGLSLPPILPREHKQEFPLSWAQERLWLLNQFEGSSAIYNISGAIRISGSLNINAFTQASSEIIRRHEILRSSFQTVNGKPIQVIDPEVTMNINMVDLQQHSETERETLLIQLAQKEAITPFDLEIAPLIRCTLLKLEPTEYLFLSTMHHIVSDGWSMGIFIQEFSNLYQAFCTGKPSPLPELPIQYVDFAVWQREYLSGAVLESQINYWKEQLDGAPELLQLPTDRPRSTVPTFRGSTQSLTLNTELSQKLQNLSRESGSSLFMTMLAGFQVLLQRYTNQDDIVVGTDVANRNRTEIEPLIGFFVNLLVLRTDLSGNPSFRELLKRVREVTLEAYTHQDLPFDKLVQALQPDRNFTHTPLFQVLFVLQNAPMPPLELPGVTITPFQRESKTTKFDLALFLIETEKGINISCNYKTDLFDDSTIKRMLSHFEILLNSIVTEPDTRINNLEMLTDQEKEQKTLKKKKHKASKLKKLMAVQTQAVELSQDKLVKTDYLESGEMLPLVIVPDVDDLNILEWAKNNRDFIETELVKNGAILFRNFGVNSVVDFERFAEAICPGLFGDYGDLPREGVSGKVYGSTP